MYKSGIYVIINTINNHKYIGSSVNLYNRIHGHLNRLKNNSAHNKHLQSAWNKYGGENFEYDILEFCNPEIRFEREQYYIDNIKPEYNFSLQVVANFGRKVTEEEKHKISETLKRRYRNHEIKTYRQQHIWKTHYIYDIITFKLVGIMPNGLLTNKLISAGSHPHENIKVH